MVKRARDWAGWGEDEASTDAAVAAAAAEAAAYKRKEKSLSQLTVKFLRLCMTLPTHLIDLNAAAKDLDVGRRRLYDIINILETIGYCTRLKKNTYILNGPDSMRLVLNDIKVHVMKPPSDEGETDEVADGKISFTLGKLCEKFIGFMFLSTSGETTLEVVADFAYPLKNHNDKIAVTGHKSCIRRLYDVANVLVSVGLIEKIAVHSHCRKPSFRWVFPMPSIEKFPVASPIPRVISAPTSPIPSSTFIFSTPARPNNGTPLTSNATTSAFQSLTNAAIHRPPSSISLVSHTPLAERTMHHLMDMDLKNVTLDSTRAHMEFLAEYRSALCAWKDRTVNSGFVYSTASNPIENVQ